MNEDEQVEEEDNLQANKQKLQNVESHSGQKKSFAVNRSKINPLAQPWERLRRRGRV